MTMSLGSNKNALVIGLLLSITAPEDRKDECLKTVNELLDQMAAKHREYLMKTAMGHAEDIMKRPTEELAAYLKEVKSAKKGSA